MKRALHNKGKLVTAKWSYLILALLMSVSQLATAQVDCNITMACNDLIQVSLDDQCQAEIFPDMMLENPAYANSSYTVTLLDQNGNLIPGTSVDASHIGMTLQVKVTLTGCANSCWGYITVEDKLAPVITCTDVTVGCTDNTNPSSQVPFPIVNEACGGPVDITYSDMTEDMSCADAFARVITRTFTVTDNQGNASTCAQTISVMRASLIDVVFPPSYDGIEADMIICGTVFPTTDQGAPHPSYTGFPTAIDCPNIQFYYTDVLFEVCGAGQKVLRQWVVIDWCTGEESVDNQIIKVIDNAPPVCTAQPDFVDVILTDPEMCTGTYIVPAPIVTFECSDFDYTVGYKLRDENGNPFTNPITDNVVRLPNGLYKISGLPQDTSWIVYTITDACGNSTKCFTEVLVTDQEAPNAICDGYTIVSLDDSGSAKVYATSVNDFSYDNCTDVTVSLRRLSAPCGHPEDVEFGEFVHLCCDDVVNSPIIVILRVEDENGNINECTANVNVQDKFPPTISCPATVNLECGDDYTDMSITGGMATANDNCGVEVEFLGYNTNGLNACGVGFVLKNFRVTDPQGRTASCSQRVNIINTNPFSEDDIVFPNDMTLSSCNMNSYDPSITGLPIISNDQCASIAISYTDQVFQQVDDLCLKVLRTWRVLDECNGNITSSNFYTNVQKISVSNTVAPTFTTTCANQTVIADEGECDAFVSVSVQATDDCTSDNALLYNYTIDYDNNGSVDFAANGKNASGVYPSGTHRVTFTVMDQCGNTRECSSTITVSDGKAPTPVCLGEVIWAIDESGNAEVWASDFNLKSFDDCDGENVTFAFNAAGTETVRSFDCSDIPNGMAAEIVLNMYVFDQSGNSDFCEVRLILQDNENDACIDDGSMGRVEGHIFNRDLDPVSTVGVSLFEMEESSLTQTSVTDEEGSYTFNELPYFDGYMVKPASSGAHNHGVTTLDLVLIQRHILGLQTLEEPQVLIAADVNGSSNISASDIVELRKVVLGVNLTFSNNTAWKFIPTTFEFPDPAFPWDYPTEVMLDHLFFDKTNVDFYGIKVGDVNGSATKLSSSNESEVRSVGLALEAVNTTFAKGDLITVPLVVTENTQIEGAQFTIEFDPAVLDYQGISGDKANINGSHINATMADRGLLSISYDHVMGLELDANDIMMSIQFVTLTEATLEGNLDITSELIRAEAYDLSHEIAGITFEIRDEYEVNLKKTTLTTTPNPFSDETTIRFTLDRDQIATVRVVDVQGRVLVQLTNAFAAGVNNVQINKNQLSSNGLYYYQLETEDGTIIKKMIMIE